MLFACVIILLLSCISSGISGAEESFKNLPLPLQILIEHDYLQPHLSHEAAITLSRVNQYCAATINRYRSKLLGDLNKRHGDSNNAKETIHLNNGMYIYSSNVILDASGNRAYGIFLDRDLAYLCHFTYPVLECIATQALDIIFAQSIGGTSWCYKVTPERTFGSLSVINDRDMNITFIAYSFAQGITTMAAKDVGVNLICTSHENAIIHHKMHVLVLIINGYRLDKDQKCYRDGLAVDHKGNKLAWKPIAWKLCEKSIMSNQ